LAWAATGAKANPEKTYAISSWNDLPAVRNKQVYVLPDELLNTPGPPLVEGVHRLFQVFQSVARRNGE
jgi:ABC-type Fe3+-hydroxamate transport system substrate-binding protein